MSYRTDEGWGEKEDQERYVQDIRDGKREHEGAKREWADRIEMVEGGNEEKVVSSTLARKVAKEEPGRLGEFVDDRVGEWINKEKLYLD